MFRRQVYTTTYNKVFKPQRALQEKVLFTQKTQKNGEMNRRLGADLQALIDDMERVRGSENEFDIPTSCWWKHENLSSRRGSQLTLKVEYN